MEALVIRKKVRVKGSERIEEEMVWESFWVKIVKNCEEGGKPAASKRLWRRLWIVGNRDEVEGTIAWEIRTETEKGKAMSATTEVKCW